MYDVTNDKIINEIESLLEKARTHVVVEVNNTLLNTYMEIGRLLFDNNLSFTNEDASKEKSLRALSKELTKKFGKGFSKSNLNNMINFYLEYNSVQTLSERLSWPHYCELLSISDKDVMNKTYPLKDFHTMYIGKIEKILINQ